MEYGAGRDIRVNALQPGHRHHLLRPSAREAAESLRRQAGLDGPHRTRDAIFLRARWRDAVKRRKRGLFTVQARDEPDGVGPPSYVGSTYTRSPRRRTDIRILMFRMKIPPAAHVLPAPLGRAMVAGEERNLNNARRWLAAAAMVGSLACAHAAPVQWNLSGVAFDDGNTASGSFTYDAATNVYSGILITTSALGTIYDTTELLPDFGFPSATALALIDGFVSGANTNKPLFLMSFVSGLTDAGGSVALAVGNGLNFEGICGTPPCSTGGISRTITAGSVVSAQVSAPATLPLVGAALFCLAAITRRRPA